MTLKNRLRMRKKRRKSKRGGHTHIERENTINLGQTLTAG